MRDFEWVGDEPSESYREDLYDQVIEYKDQRARKRYLVQLMVSFLSLIFLIQVTQYFLYMLPQSPQTYSINISDALINQQSPAALTYKGVALEFGMGTPNKIIAFLVGLIAIFLLLEFFLNALRISKNSIHQADNETTDHSTLKKWKRENQVTIDERNYLLSGMQNKWAVLIFPGAVSLYMLQVLTGYAYLGSVLNPAFQIIILDIIVIISSLLAFLYLVFMVYKVATELFDTPEKMDHEPVGNRIRTALRSHMKGVFGPLSAITTIVLWYFIIYSGMIGYLLEILNLWIYAQNGLG